MPGMKYYARASAQMQTSQARSVQTYEVYVQRGLREVSEPQCAQEVARHRFIRLDGFGDANHVPMRVMMAVAWGSSCSVFGFIVIAPL